eukprot:TRINITY_DN6038_c0_g1_i3.p1 TRINITY_DN6038_c0_g1~~TRINITY_DN6038_c0_g1_i3.p1  ORF type:complete len:132 (-),score=1.97 TRINITY_DN6038_c0_g1_i3:541-936(-)
MDVLHIMSKHLLCRPFHAAQQLPAAVTRSGRLRSCVSNIEVAWFLRCCGMCCLITLFALPRNAYKGLLHVDVSFGRCFKEINLELIRQLLTLLLGNHPPILHISLVPNKNLADALRCVLLNVSDPPTNTVE